MYIFLLTLQLGLKTNIFMGLMHSGKRKLSMNSSVYIAFLILLPINTRREANIDMRGIALF